LETEGTELGNRGERIEESAPEYMKSNWPVDRALDIRGHRANQRFSLIHEQIGTANFIKKWTGLIFVHGHAISMPFEFA
jgi:hypothetical protein